MHYADIVDQTMTKKIDLTSPRMVSLEEMAQLWDTTIVGIRNRVLRGTFPVRPKATRPLRWSSTELEKFFADDRKRG